MFHDRGRRLSELEAEVEQLRAWVSERDERVAELEDSEQAACDRVHDIDAQYANAQVRIDELEEMDRIELTREHAAAELAKRITELEGALRYFVQAALEYTDGAMAHSDGHDDDRTSGKEAFARADAAPRSPR